MEVKPSMAGGLRGLAGLHQKLPALCSEPRFRTAARYLCDKWCHCTSVALLRRSCSCFCTTTAGCSLPRACVCAHMVVRNNMIIRLRRRDVLLINISMITHTQLVVIIIMLMRLRDHNALDIVMRMCSAQSQMR